MLAYHTIRAPAEYRSRDLPVPRPALYHWATDLLSCTVDGTQMCRRFELRSGSQRHRHYVGFINVPVQAPTRSQPFYGYSEKPPHFSRVLRHAWGYGGHILDITPGRGREKRKRDKSNFKQIPLYPWAYAPSSKCHSEIKVNGIVFIHKTNRSSKLELLYFNKIGLRFRPRSILCYI